MAAKFFWHSAERLRHRSAPLSTNPYKWLIPTTLVASYVLWSVTSNAYKDRKALEAAKELIQRAEKSRVQLVDNDDASATLTLPDGRQLGYAQYGDLKGRPVFYLHGLPGARLEAGIMHDAAIKLGARLIAIDRPGYGLSSPQPSRTMTGLAKDIEALAGHLGLDEYGLMGISAGGSYVLPCAYGLPPDKLKACAIMCGMGTPNMPKTGMNLSHQLGYTYGYIYLPALARWYFRQDVSTRLELSDDERLEKLMQGVQKNWKSFHPKDRAVFGNVDVLRRWTRTSRQAFAQDLKDSISVDGRLLSQDPGFKIEDLRKDLPVQIWYGLHDNICPPIHGVHFAARLGERATLRILDETHASLSSPKNVEIMLRALLESM